MKRKILLIIQMALLITACDINPDWDNYYGNNAKSSEEISLFKQLEKIENVSAFVNAVREYSLDTIFSNAKLYTLLAPTNEAFSQVPIEIASNPEQMRLMLLFHCFEGKMHYNDYTTGDINSMANKKMPVHFDAGGDVVWGDGARAIQQDLLLESGVIHVIDKVSYPVLNMYEYLGTNTLTTHVRNSIDNQISEVFDRWNSKIISYTSFGEPIYDSVFVETNYFLQSLPLDKEQAKFTFFFPDNLNEIEEKIRGGAEFTKEPEEGFLSMPTLRSFLFRGAYEPTDFSEDMKSFAGEEIDPKILFGAYGRKDLSNGIFYYTKNYDIDLDEYFAGTTMLGREVYDAAYQIGDLSRFEFYASKSLLINYVYNNEITDEFLGAYGEEIPESSPIRERSLVVNVHSSQFLPIKYKLYATLGLYKNYPATFDIYVNDTIPTMRFDYPSTYLDDPNWEYSSKTPGIDDYHEFELGEFFLEEVTSNIFIRFDLVKRHESGKRGFGGSDNAHYLFLKDLRVVPVRNN